MLLAQPSFLCCPCKQWTILGGAWAALTSCQLHCVYGFRGVDAIRFRVPAKLPMLLSCQTREQKSWVWERACGLCRVGRAVRAQGSGQQSLGRAGIGPVGASNSSLSIHRALISGGSQAPHIEARNRWKILCGGLE